MPWISAAVAIGGSLLSSEMQGDAAESASNAGVASTAAGIAEQRRQYDLNRADQAGFMQTGNAANQRLAYLMGLSGGSGGGSGGARLTAEQIRSQLLPSFTTAGNSGAPKEGDPGYVPGDYVMRNGQWGTWTTNGDQSPYWYSPGGGTATGPTIDESGLQAAINARLSAQGPEGDPNDPAYGLLARRFTMADRDADPVYKSGLQFGLDQGTGAINARALQSGNYDSGATLKALTRYANDYGTTKAEGAYNRFNTDNTNTYNRLAGLSGAGQTATNQVSTAGSNTANQISGLQTDAGTARAAGIIGAGNAWGNGIANATNAGTSYLKSLLNGSGNGNGGYSYAGQSYNNPSAFIAG